MPRKKMKRANGTGSVYKLSGRRRKPWIARVTIGKIEDKQIYQTIGYYETETDGKLALDMHHINPVPPKADITLKELHDEWSKLKYDTVGKTTSDNYKLGWNYISILGKSKFTDLRTFHFQKIINEAYKAKKSKSTLEKIKVVIYMLYGYAMENDIINKNYAQFIKLPSFDKKEKSIFTDMEIKKLEKNKDVEWVDTILILIYSGMRISEMLNLTKFNVDLENGFITGGVKTDAGKNRIIPIHPKIYPHIKKWYDKDSQYLIHNKKGEKLSPRAYREGRYYPALEKLKITKLNPHCCRHTFASLLDRSGANKKAMQELIGHSNYAFTEDTYIHKNKEELKEAINMI